MRNMSFALTTEQVRQQTKTVTRRIGWQFLRPGDQVQPIVRGQGLKKGEKVEKIGGPIRITGVRIEQLDRLLEPVYGAEEVRLEGGRWPDGAAFVEAFKVSHRCATESLVTRIEFEYV